MGAPPGSRRRRFVFERRKPRANLTTIYSILHDWSHSPLEGPEPALALERWEGLEDAPRAVRESIPMRWTPWRLPNWESAGKELPAPNEKAPVDLRVNTSLTTIDDLQKMLLAEEVPTNKVEGFPKLLTLPETQKRLPHQGLPCGAL